MLVCKEVALYLVRLFFVICYANKLVNGTKSQITKRFNKRGKKRKREKLMFCYAYVLKFKGSSNIKLLIILNTNQIQIVLCSFSFLSLVSFSYFKLKVQRQFCQTVRFCLLSLLDFSDITAP